MLNVVSAVVFMLILATGFAVEGECVVFIRKHTRT